MLSHVVTKKKKKWNRNFTCKRKFKLRSLLKFHPSFADRPARKEKIHLNLAQRSFCPLYRRHLWLNFLFITPVTNNYSSYYFFLRNCLFHFICIHRNMPSHRKSNEMQKPIWKTLNLKKKILAKISNIISKKCACCRPSFEIHDFINERDSKTNQQQSTKRKRKFIAYRIW